MNDMSSEFNEKPTNYVPRFSRCIATGASHNYTSFPNNFVVCSYCGHNFQLTQNSESNSGSSLPAGLVCAFPSNVIPAGWLPLDGQEYDSETYPELVSISSIFS